MKFAVVRSVCECQARLSAQVDEGGRATDGRASYRGEQLIAPANVLHPRGDYFDVGWLCPFCTRNTLRAFYAGALVWRETEIRTNGVTVTP